VQVPWDRLGIPKQHRQVLTADAPVKARLAAARGLLPVAPAMQLAMFYVLLNDGDPSVVSAARASFADMPEATAVGAISQRTHPKILEYLAQVRIEERLLMERVLEVRNCNDRTVLRIAEYADAALCEVMSRNQERLLLTPTVFLALRDNPNCASAWIEKMQGFLRMQGALPQEPIKPAPAPPPKAPEPAPPPVQPTAVAEVEAMLAGLVSPSTYVDKAIAEEIELFDLDFLDDGPELAEGEIDPELAGFQLDYKDEAEEFNWNLLQEASGGEEDQEEVRNMEKIINDMPVGSKIKLAYLGNGQARRILIRDRNKMVSGAVVKSGRMNEREVENAAGNRNLDTEVIRELTRNRDYMRKYQVKKALLNNPKTPVAVASSLLKFMQFKDVKDLAKNKNVSSVVQMQAKRMVVAKEKKGR